MTQPIPLHLRRLALAALATSLLGALNPAQDVRPNDPEDPSAFLDRLEAAWQTRNLEAWLALREFATPEERTLEVATVSAAFGADETVLTFLRRPTLKAGDSRFAVEVQMFTTTEPQTRVTI
jgi:hypothetical protein